MDRQGFVEASPPRRASPLGLQATAGPKDDPIYAERHEGWQILFWPLYYTSFLIDDLIADQDFFGART